VRPRMRLPRPPDTAPGRLGHRPEDGPGCGGPPRCLHARGPGRAGAVPALRFVRTRDGARQGSGGLERPLRGALAGAVGVALAALTLAGCGGNDDEQASPTPTPSTPPTSPPTTAEPAPAPPPPFLIGAVDDAVRNQGPTLDQLRDAGFGAVAITSVWQPGLLAAPPEELAVLRDVAERAGALRVVLRVYHAGSVTTPLTDDARGQFAAYVAAILREIPRLRDVIVGNEPNLNRFWMPQFDENGSDAAAPAYFALLAEVYDTAKEAADDATIWGGALAPRGIDRPGTGRDTHSPTVFIRDLGAAYRASGRTRPPLDGFAFHPYPASSSIPPDRPTAAESTSIGLADYEEKLAPLLEEAFGRRLPVLYSELGVETTIPPDKAPLYEGTEAVRPVDETTQADYYRRAIELAACQQGVAGLLLFHSHDEPSLVGFQSGVYYVDGTPKTSLVPVRAAIMNTGC
jgi:hypothetical protein